MRCRSSAVIGAAYAFTEIGPEPYNRAARCYMAGDYAVRQRAQERSAVALRLRKALHDFLDSVVHEPPPERWVDLIHRLNEEERRKAPAARKPTRH
jgi:hypothetical protein